MKIKDGVSQSLEDAYSCILRSDRCDTYTVKNAHKHAHIFITFLCFLLCASAFLFVIAILYILPLCQRTSLRHAYRTLVPG